MFSWQNIEFDAISIESCGIQKCLQSRLVVFVLILLILPANLYISDCFWLCFRCFVSPCIEKNTLPTPHIFPPSKRENSAKLADGSVGLSTYFFQCKCSPYHRLVNNTLIRHANKYTFIAYSQYIRCRMRSTHCN